MNLKPFERASTLVKTTPEWIALTIPQMKPKSISVSEFKAKCLDIIREVQEENVSYTITKHRKVVAQVNPLTPPDTNENPLKDAILFMGDVVSPIDVEWEADMDTGEIT